MPNAAVYFSPTGNTKKSVLAMMPALGPAFEDMDITVPGTAGAEFDSASFVVFGAPVYGGRIPQVCVDRFRRFRGNGTPCIVVVTYGNRHYDDALLELADLVTENGFVVKGGAALVGRHTFGDIQATRPDPDDLAADLDFARRAAAGSDSPAIPGNRPYKDGGKGGSFRPVTKDGCVECGLCRDGCPTGAISADLASTCADACISCFRCIRVCPTGARVMDNPAYDAFAADFSQKLSARRENEYFL